ncbi:MAG: aminoacyl-tRNA hydrolase [Clostridiaceae bacterium]|nr:aminoacyl-tRNA hydrolase [Clostridiaceae bacterium]
MTDTKWLIAGLGNPGRKYELTWHNSGYQVLDLLSGRWQTAIDRIRYRSLTAVVRLGDTSCLLLKPLTYMNLSGEAIREALRYSQIDARHCLVIYDDIDLPVGKIRIRRSGGPGTHNGMRSILDALQHTDFPRIRIGIGPKPERWDLADYVLSKVPPDQEAAWRESLMRAADAVDTIIKEGLDTAISRCQAP